MKWINAIRQRLTSLHCAPWTIPLALLALMMAAFGIFIPKLGFYWDDWTQLLVARLYDLSAYWQYFASDRPTSAWTHILFVPLLGFKPIYWQVFTLLLRWLTVLGMWWSIQLIWPQHRRTITAAAFLFTVYPAFVQQPNAVAYHQHWLQFALYFASLGCMILARQRRKGKLGWMFLSLALQALQLSITEFYVGIELVRPLILWFLLSEEKNKFRRLGKSLFAWLPYFLLLAGYSSWRLFFSGIEKHTPALLYLLRDNPLAGLMQLFHLASMDVLYISISSWAKTLDIGLRLVTQPLIVLSWLISLIVILGMWVYFQSIPDDAAQKPDQKKEIFWLGIFVSLVGPLPIWLTSGHILVDNDFHADRFAMASMWGISLVLVILIEFLIRRWRRAALMISILMGLAVGLHIRTAIEYREIWMQEQRFYWQLLWRAPQIQPGTALVSEDIFLDHQELFSTSSAINHLYPQSGTSRNLAYWMYRLTPAYEAIGANENPSFKTVHRIYSFQSTLEDSIGIQFEPQISGCLWVLTADDALNPDVPSIMQQAAVHFDLSRIGNIEQSDSQYPPTEMIGSEPAQRWCYFYEKAELAAQYADWQQVIVLANQARDMGYVPAEGESKHAREWLPIIQAYIHENEFETAAVISDKLIKSNKEMRPMLCSVWKNNIQQGSQDQADMLNWIDQLQCGFE